MQKYFVVWYDKQNPKINGKGSIELSYETAKGWVDFLNKQYPNLQHGFLPCLKKEVQDEK